jgi:SAM-dependent methyltransferase
MSPVGVIGSNAATPPSWPPRQNAGVEGYRPETYGDAIADVYDEWYPMDEEGRAAVGFLYDASNGGPVLELGVGTGKLAIPLAERGLAVHGVDASPAMLAKLQSKPGGDLVQTHLGDMASDLPAGPFALVYVATNTFFGLASVAEQQRAFGNVAARLGESGRFVVDAFVPDDPPRSTSMVEVQKVFVDRVVIAVSDADIVEQLAWGQMVEISETGIRMRPWRVRYSTPAELDAMAATAGLRVVERYATWEKDAFTDDSTNHVSVYGHSGYGHPEARG